MSNSATSAPANDLTAYKKLFLQHLRWTQSHSTGNTDKPLISSLHPPHAFWTSQEKNRFFYALSRYSKLRPDLIASFVGGKSVVDVLGYLEVLEEGSKKEGGYKGKEKPIGGARVVSDKWIQLEERMSARLVQQEIAWGAEKRTIERDDEEDDLELRREDAMESLGRYELAYLDSLIRKELESLARSDSAQPSPSPDPNDRSKSSSPADNAEMTPAERRRLQKRLHMRRKRAEAAGKEVDLDEGRLKTGRKTARPQPFDRVQSSRSSASPASRRTSGDDSDSEEESGGEKYKARGLTASQKAQQEFEELGIDIDYVKERDLELFNLTRFNGLWKMFSPGGEIKDISYLAIKLLRAYLEEFLHELMRRSIVLAESERAMKDGTKVWHEQRGEVKTSHVEDALALLGMSRERKSSGLREREAELTGPSTSTSSQLDTNSIHYSVYPRLVNHEALLDGPDVLMEEEVLLHEEEEDERAAQMEELAEDLILEERDERMDVRHEKALWKAMGVADGGARLAGRGKSKRAVVEESTGSSEEEDTEEDTSKKEEEDVPMRKRYHDAMRLRPIGGNVKSQPFIFSDDEEKVEMEM